MLEFPPPLPFSTNALHVCLDMMNIYMFGVTLMSKYIGRLTRIVVSGLFLWAIGMFTLNFIAWITS